MAIVVSAALSFANDRRIRAITGRINPRRDQFETKSAILRRLCFSWPDLERFI